MDETLIEIIGCCHIDRMKKQCQKYDLTRVIEMKNESEEQLETYEMTTEEEITKEDILNITGSMFDTMLNYVDNSNNELERLQQENKKYKEVIDKANNFIINHLRQDMLSDFTGANYIQEYIINPDELLDILKEVE